MIIQKPRNTLIMISLAILLTACASIDFDYPKTESTALADTDQTTLGRSIGPIVAEFAIRRRGRRSGEPCCESPFVHR